MHTVAVLHRYGNGSLADPHDPTEMAGATTFHFVSDGVESAYAQAKAAAGDRDRICATTWRGSGPPEVLCRAI
jgi:hypothetical protein